MQCNKHAIDYLIYRSKRQEIVLLLLNANLFRLSYMKKKNIINLERKSADSLRVHAND